MDDAVKCAHRAQGEWAAHRPEVRGEILAGIADALENRANILADALVRDIGKPLTEARAEVARAIELARVAIRQYGAAHPWERCGGDVRARRVPIGTVAAITPFNHALGIPIGKLFPALVLGNAVIWKPSLFGAAVAELVVEAFSASPLPVGLVGLLHGDGSVAQQLARHPGIEAVSVTASESAGRQLALACAAHFKPLQAELGGNNAVVVMHDADIPAIAAVLARAAFGFAGQRCTAGRRILVVREREAELLQALEAATRALVVGEPGDVSTEVGPLVSAEARDAIADVVTRALEGGAGVVCGGIVPRGLDHGAWYAPTLLRNVAPETRIFREESFGPVALVSTVRDFDEALTLVNAVPQGLVATLYSDDPHLQERFLTEVRAGLLKINCPPAGVHAEAPFGGWKASGLGPPEHGRWDAEFYTRVQAIYGITGPPKD
ncbi:aldehyde dehydrogenase [Thioalkalivibrio paradoxus ARh 1]|uniref:aldehyde dehydrogenase (NAD(+)) n=1 Tax=Thioalkalivibrio paradoxus ARh 1 TaxID=713585 RepID=W0DJ35_9GAMM|nr:aldehyde dehydrogenase [Thioalkalivibrio paradoxus ARh 1]